ncbi:MAG: Asp-tRNA(Asn)/Glu-tRNA(Gln) amidotransferase subunit GatB [Nitrospirae bacterium]|nr:Asp-tRNA(Asn)/Glu-tRNA(Gln) amidotransferase subunit GatB [Nitrospirota bacterium]
MTTRYEAVIGLEVHAQLLTRSKNFCGCSTRFGKMPNTQTCPVCIGMPGVLPVLNRTAVEYAIKTALALGCAITPHGRFARKNYFYPDLPKGYQISQYELPIGTMGALEIVVGGEVHRIGITRVHLEEDAGKNLHEGGDGVSFVDMNRCGVPLMEIVSEPDIRTAEEAAAYMRELRSILRYLEVCDGNMEQGSLRCDANVSIRPEGSADLGVKAEVKNMNSFKFVQKALEYEIARQIRVIEEGGRIVQETRLWDPDQEITVSMRSKEEAHDYRYFPEPDLVPLVIDEAWQEEVRRTLPELPAAKRERFVRQYALPKYDADELTATASTAASFEATVKAGASPKAASNWIMGEIQRLLNLESIAIEACPVSPERLAELLKRIEDGTVSGKLAKTVLEAMFKTGKDAAAIIAEQGLTQISDTAALERAIAEVLARHQKELVEYRAGKEKLFGFFVGQVMKATQGKANPGLLNEILKKRLAG